MSIPSSLPKMTVEECIEWAMENGIKGIELEDGVVVEKPVTECFVHANTVRAVYHALDEWSGRRAWMSGTIKLAVDTGYDPDVFVLAPGKPDVLQAAAPVEDCEIVVEVSHSTMRRDLGKKADRYAAAGVAEYWDVLAEEDAPCTVLRHTEARDGQYRLVHRSECGPLGEGFDPDAILNA